MLFYGYVSFLPLLGNLWSIVQYVVNWRERPSISFTGIRRKPVHYRIAQGKMEARKGYFLILNRSGNKRPEESAGKIQIDGEILIIILSGKTAISIHPWR